MPRERTGQVEPHGDHYDVRVKLPDGRRSPRMHLDPGLTLEDAKREATALQRLSDARHGVQRAPAISAGGPTLEAWAEDWFADRERRGLSSVEADQPRWRKWIPRELGAKAIASITREDIERLVSTLDDRVRAGELSWKTAVNVWTLVRRAFGDASAGKVLTLRVRKDNPTSGVRGPDRGVRRSKAFLYPTEALRLLACEAVPLAFRRAVAIALYTGLRAAELRALDWSNVDVQHGTMHVHTTLDRRGKQRATKTKRARTVPIEPNLLPLLRAMHAQQGGRGRVVRARVSKDLARFLKIALCRADVQRADLHVKGSDKTRVAFRWHDLRGTFCTWAAARGEDVLRIMARAGHEDIKTTEGYVVLGGVLGLTLGQVFPPLPASLLASVDAAAPLGREGGREARSVPGSGEAEGPAENPVDRSPRSPQGSPQIGANLAESLWVDRDSKPSKNEQLRALDVGFRTLAPIDTDATDPDASASVAVERPDASAEHTTAGRGEAIARLAGMLATFARAGDMGGARTMHEAIGALLPATARTGHETAGGAVVVDLEAERERRTGTARDAR